MEKGLDPVSPARQDDRAVPQFRPFPGLEMEGNGMFIHPEVLLRRKMKERARLGNPVRLLFPGHKKCGAF